MKLIREGLPARKARFAERKATLGLRKAVFSQEGAIDLASIMVGVIVIGIIGGIIAATVFAVIPWSQNEAAKQSLGSVKEAESVAFAQSVSAGTGVYLDYATITEEDGLGADEGLLQKSDNIGIEVGSDVKGSQYIAVAKSATKKHFYIVSTNPSTVLEEGKDDAAIAAAFTALTITKPATAPWN